MHTLLMVAPPNAHEDELHIHQALFKALLEVMLALDFPRAVWQAVGSPVEAPAV